MRSPTKCAISVSLTQAFAEVRRCFEDLSQNLQISVLTVYKIARGRKKPLPKEVVEVIHKSVQRAATMCILYMVKMHAKIFRVKIAIEKRSIKF